MALSAEDRDILGSFFAYIEDTVSHDERYGSSSRIESDDESLIAMRFENSKDEWFEIAVIPAKNILRAAFITTSKDLYDDIETAGEENGGSFADIIDIGVREAGLHGIELTVERYTGADGEFGYATRCSLEWLDDLDKDPIRTRALSMMEAFMIGLGGMLNADLDFEDFDDEE